jgi:hypothetical protein
MINSLDNSQFFDISDIDRLRSLGLWQENHTMPVKLAFAGLMLAPIMQISTMDRATSATEFQAIEEYVRRIEREFELATKENMETIGTEMGMLPMIKGTWGTAKFRAARAMLIWALERLEEQEAHDVRNAIAKGCLDVARAGGAHLLSVHTVDTKEKPLIHEIINDLRLETTAEGPHLLGKTGNT